MQKVHKIVAMGGQRLRCQEALRAPSCSDAINSPVRAQTNAHGGHACVTFNCDL